MHLFIKKGEDKAIKLPLLDSGHPIDVGTAGLVHNITATVFSGQTETSARYSISDQSEFQELTIDSMNNNVLKFQLLGKDTTHFPYGILTVRVKIYWVDNGFPENTRLQILTIPLGRVVNY
ncbi:MAG: hypothetical protein K1X92_08905 [Bacteroidia bacterium]|nr:hypothetical protein [Bacteroidia bacterium]